MNDEPRELIRDYTDLVVRGALDRLTVREQKRRDQALAVLETRIEGAVASRAPEVEEHAFSAHDLMAQVLEETGYSDDDPLPGRIDGLVEATGLDALGVKDKDRRKIRGVERPPVSGYTPPSTRNGLQDYFGGLLETAFASAPGGAPTRVVTASDEEVALSDEAMAFFGLSAARVQKLHDVPRRPSTEPPPPPSPKTPSVPSAGIQAQPLPLPLSALTPLPDLVEAEDFGDTQRIEFSTPAPLMEEEPAPEDRTPPTPAPETTQPASPQTRSAARPSRPVPAKRPQVSARRPQPGRANRRPAVDRFRGNASVTMLDGRKLDCALSDLKPESGSVRVRTREARVEIDLADVLCIRFSRDPHHEPRAREGQALIVTLRDGDKLSGLSPDYAPGVPWMELRPKPSDDETDWIWIPAWSVRGIELA